MPARTPRRYDAPDCPDREAGLLAWTGETGSRVTVAEESGGRERVASITFASHDEAESWGEFLTWTEALALRSWLDLLLARAGRA